jgi:hypothetical protein
MIDANSPLVKENMIPPNVPALDPWKQPYEGSCTKGSYVLKCAGDPTGSEERKAFTVEPGRMQDAPGQAPTSPSAPSTGTAP